MRIAVGSLVFWAFGIVLAAAALAQDDLRHYQVGDLRILAMRDAAVGMDRQILPGLDMHPEFAGVFDRGPAQAVSQTFYFKDGSHHVLVDAGWGSGQKVTGKTASLLRDSGIDPKDITDILLTHMDHDHIGGLLENGRPVYPNATLWISRPEYEAWTGRKISGRGAASLDLAARVAAAYKTRLFNYGDEILPGVTSVDASGHTPGHTAYDIRSGRDSMTIAGDLLHVAQVQLALPGLSSTYDIDQSLAAESRRRLLERAAEGNSLFAGMHFPMISSVRRAGDGYVMMQPR